MLRPKKPPFSLSYSDIAFIRNHPNVTANYLAMALNVTIEKATIIKAEVLKTSFKTNLKTHET